MALFGVEGLSKKKVEHYVLSQNWYQTFGCSVFDRYGEPRVGNVQSSTIAGHYIPRGITS